jgi:hypothetical protein
MQPRSSHTVASESVIRYIGSTRKTSSGQTPWYDVLHEKHFTLKQAQSALRHVKPLVEELVVLKKALDARGYNIYRHEYFGGSGPNGDRFHPPELERLVAILGMLEDRGVLVKGIEEGLIDFPHLRKGGDEVYLCFKAGEKEIAHWHTINGGFAGRRPLSDL